MPNNTHSGRSCNWQENSLTVAVGLGQWEERNNHAADPRATSITCFGRFGLSGSILPITDSEMTAVLELDICSLNLSGVKTASCNRLFASALSYSGIVFITYFGLNESGNQQEKNTFCRACKNINHIIAPFCPESSSEITVFCGVFRANQ